MFKFPRYKNIPSLELGQHVEIIIEGIKIKKRHIRGKIVYKNERFITIQDDKIRIKESICLVDFITGNARLRGGRCG